MQRIYPQESFIGPHRIHLDECESTNDLADTLLGQGLLKHGSVISTDYQTAGKGQAGNVWLSEPNVNIACSAVLQPSFLEISRQFFLNIIASLAVHDVLSAQISGNLSIKWPNDIMLNDKKVCGILVKNHITGKSISNTIVGIGINVNQEHLPVEKATSMFIEAKKRFKIERIYEYLFKALAHRYSELEASGFDHLKGEYLSSLYWKDEPHYYKSGAREFKGVLTGIDEVGRLKVKKNGTEAAYSMKEIAYVK